MPTRSPRLLAFVFALLLTTLVAAALLPFTPFDPLWQLRVSGALPRNASLALIAMGLIAIAPIAFLDPEDPLLEQRQRRSSRFAAAACLGFLLLVPLQISAGIHQLRSLSAAEGMTLIATQRKMIRQRQAVQTASGVEDLNARSRALQGPTLGPVPAGQSFAQVKAQVTASLDQSQAQITRKRAALESISPMRLAPDLLRDSVAALILAFGFSLFGRLPGSDVSLIEDLQLRLHQRSLERSRESRDMSEAELLRRIALEDEEMDEASDRVRRRGP